MLCTMIALEAWLSDIFIGRLRLTVPNIQSQSLFRVNRDRKIANDWNLLHVLIFQRWASCNTSLIQNQLITLLLATCIWNHWIWFITRTMAKVFTGHLSRKLIVQIEPISISSHSTTQRLSSNKPFWVSLPFSFWKAWKLCTDSTFQLKCSTRLVFMLVRNKTSSKFPLEMCLSCDFCS